MKTLVLPKKLKISKRNLLFELIAGFIIYSCIMPLIIFDIWASIYQWIYFGLKGIPKISKNDFIVIDRHQLKKLNIFQKVNCIYCGYANGLIAWIKAIINQTELYSCAIKHKSPSIGQEHQKHFYDFDDFV
ncbi:hypothetical protein GF362_00460 [Candidatus Dojkabacteria bacterium]|nr:hypothetical protein [Candidatus Dojkabacteria bacterium]